MRATRRHRVRNVAATVAITLFGVMLPLTIVKGSEIVGGTATLAALWAVFGAAALVLVFSTDYVSAKCAVLPVRWVGWGGRQREAEIRRQWLAGIAKRLFGELVVAREHIDEAIKRSVYRDPDFNQVATPEWSANEKVVSTELEFSPHYLALRLAFGEIDRVNKVALERRHHGYYSSSQTDPSDRLPDALAKVDAGLESLTLVLTNI